MSGCPMFKMSGCSGHCPSASMCCGPLKCPQMFNCGCPIPKCSKPMKDSGPKADKKGSNESRKNSKCPEMSCPMFQYPGCCINPNEVPRYDKNGPEIHCPMSQKCPMSRCCCNEKSKCSFSSPKEPKSKDSEMSEEPD